MLVLKQEGVLVDAGGTSLTEEQILSLTGAGRDEAYEGLERWREFIAEKVRREAVSSVLNATVGFMMEHPGSSRIEDGRDIYTDEFRDFVLSMTGPGAPGEVLSDEDLARATHVPVGLLQEWVRAHGRGGRGAC